MMFDKFEKVFMIVFGNVVWFWFDNVLNVLIFFLVFLRLSRLNKGVMVVFGVMLVVGCCVLMIVVIVCLLVLSCWVVVNLVKLSGVMFRVIVFGE